MATVAGSHWRQDVTKASTNNGARDFSTNTTVSSAIIEANGGGGALLDTFEMQQSTSIQLDESLPKIGRPANFGIVVPGVYRSSFPQADDHEFISRLNLKTIV